MKATLRKMGNSQGVIIPKVIIKQLALEDEIERTLTETGLHLEKAPSKLRQGWAEAAQALAASGDDGLVWPELSNEGDEALPW